MFLKLSSERGRKLDASSMRFIQGGGLATDVESADIDTTNHLIK